MGGRAGSGFQQERGYDGTAAYALNQEPDPAVRPGSGFDDLYRGIGRYQDLPRPGGDADEDNLALDTAGRRRIGSMSARLGAAVIAGSAVIGLLAALIDGGQPAQVLGLVGIFVIIGTIAAGVLVRSGATYLLIPIPAPAYAVAAVIIGLLRDHVALSSHTALAVSAAQWAADGFFSMMIATAAAAGMTAVRLAADWVYHRRSDAQYVATSPVGAGADRGRGSRSRGARVANPDSRDRAAGRRRSPDSAHQEPSGRGSRSGRPGSSARLGTQDLPHAAVRARVDDHRVGADVAYRGKVGRIGP